MWGCDGFVGCCWLRENFFEPKKEGREKREGEGEEKVCRGVEVEHLGLLTAFPLFKTLNEK